MRKLVTRTLLATSLGATMVVLPAAPSSADTANNIRVLAVMDNGGPRCVYGAFVARVARTVWDRGIAKGCIEEIVSRKRLDGVQQLVGRTGEATLQWQATFWPTSTPGVILGSGRWWLSKAEGVLAGHNAEGTVRFWIDYRGGADDVIADYRGTIWD